MYHFRTDEEFEAYADEHHDGDTEQAWRALALAQFLGAEPEDIHHEGDNLFSACPRMAKRGSGPSEIKARVQLVKDTIQAMRGEIPSLERLQLDTINDKELSALHAATMRTVNEQAKRLLARLERHAEKSGHWARLLLAQAKGKNGDEAPAYITAERYVKDVGHIHESWHIQEDMAAHLETIKAAADLEEQRRALWSYHGLYAQALKEQPEAVRVGIHDFANTLYFLCDPKANKDNAADHCAACAQAWNGEEIEDKRPSYRTSSGEYLVLTDDEADEAAQEYAEQYAEEFILEQIPDQARPFFKKDEWAANAVRLDGRGHMLSTYDGEEREIAPDGGGFYFIYRTN